MFSSERQASLTTGLLAAKEQTLSDESGAAGTAPSASLVALPPRGGARQRMLAAVRRTSSTRGSEEAETGTNESPTAEPAAESAAQNPPQDSVLYSKGDASASGFRPWYWSYDRGDAPAPPPASADADPAKPAGAATSEARRRGGATAVLGVLAGFSTLALVGSATLFILSRTATPGAAEKSATVVARAWPMAAPVPSPPQPTRVAPLPKTVAEAINAKRTVPVATSAAQLAELMARGDQLLATGDIAAARLFYERAAEGGSAAAARQTGKTYDPIFLAEAHARGFLGDPVAAARWYRKASAGGDREADVLMKRLIARYAG